ncbi:MAG TPA: hypothetical protein VGM37_05135 [Armatimonadota bacterium]
MTRQRTERQRGMALIAAIGFTFVVLALGLALLGLTTTEFRASNNQASTVVARNVAEAGAELALNQWNHQAKPARVTGNVTGTVDGASVTLGSYTVDVAENTSDHTLTISSTGTAKSAPSDPVKITVKVAGTNSGGGVSGVFAMAGFAKTTIALSGSPHTNSYDSALGPYNSGRTKTNGGLGTNSSAANAITATGGPDIKGIAMGGPGNSAAAMKAAWAANWAYPTNGFAVASKATTLPDVTAPTNGVPFSTVPVTGGNSGNVLDPARNHDPVRNNYTWNIPTGTYNLTGINLSSDQNVININGDVTLNVTGDVTTGGNTAVKVNGSLRIIVSGSVNIGASFTTIDASNPYQPAKVQIYGLPSCKTVNWSGYNDFVGVLYAPSATINLTASSNMYGAVVGNAIVINGNSMIHYDEQLANVAVAGGGGGVTTYKLQSWEQN